MKNKNYKKYFVIGVVILFVTADFSLNVCGNITQGKSYFKQDKQIMNVNTLNYNFLTFYSTNDSYICQKNPTQNFGLSQRMDVATWDGYSTSDDWQRDALIRFNLSTIQGSIIYSAILYVYYYDYMDTNPSGRPLTCKRITSNWYENTVTWNTKPPYNQSVTDSTNVPGSPGVWMDWNVTSDVELFASGVDNYGWAIMDNNTWNDFDLPVSRFRARENTTYIPYLEVIYNFPPEIPSNPIPENGAIDVSIDRDLNWTCNDPDGDNVTYDVFFGTISPPPQILWAHPTNGYSPALRYNTTHYWQIIAVDEHGASAEGPIWQFKTEEEITPDLEIESLTGGVGINLVIKNTGNGDATNVNAEFNINGGFFILPPGGSKSVSVGSISKNGGLGTTLCMVLGFGTPTVTVDVTCTEGSSANATYNPTFVILFFVL